MRRGYSIRKSSKVYYNLPFADVSLGECRIFQLLKSIGNHTNSPLSVGRRLLGAANTAPAPMRMRAKMESFIFLETQKIERALEVKNLAELSLCAVPGTLFSPVVLDDCCLLTSYPAIYGAPFGG